MAVVSRVATLKFDNGLGSNRTWVATAAVQDTPAGQSVVVTVTQTSAGAAPPAVADTLELGFFVDSGGTQVRLAALVPGSASQTVTFYLSSDGTVTGAARAGTIRLWLHAQKTTGGGLATYNADTDLTFNTPPSGFTTTVHDQGWIRGTTTATTTLAGAGTLGYGDPLTATTTLGAAPFDSRTCSVAVGTVLAATASAASTTTVLTTTFTPNTVDNRFPASAAANTTATTFPNAALTGLPWTTATLTEQTRTVDPRLSFTHLMQIDDNAFGTPPISKNQASGQRLTSQIGFLSARVTNANGVGINGITWTTTLQDAGALTAAQTATPTSTTQGGEAGWGGTFLSWTSALPGGTWNKSCTISGPATATGLGTNTATTYSLIAANPNLRIICGGGPASLGDDVKHWSPGMPFEIGLVVFNTATLTTVALDAGPTAFLGRLNYATGKVEYLASDGVTWTPATGATSYAHPLTASPTDANVYLTQFSGAQTAGWSTADVFVIGRCTVGGVPVNDFSKEIVVNGKNSHDRYAFDGPGFVGFPTR